MDEPDRPADPPCPPKVGYQTTAKIATRPHQRNTFGGSGLSAPLDVLLERVSRRTNNPYGNCIEHQAEIAHFQRTVEPLLRRGSSLELDGRRLVPELADAIAQLIEQTP